MVCSKKKTKFLLLFIFVIPLLFAASPSMESDKNKVIHQTQSILGDIKVVDRGVHRILLVDGSHQSWVERGSFQSSTSFTKNAQFAFFLNPEIENVLVVGLGAGSLSTELEKFNLKVDTVEIDENVVQAAKEYFGFKGDVFVGDGRYFIKNSQNSYDAIIFDVAAGDAFPIHMFSKESFGETKQILAKNGILVVHSAGLIDSIKIKSLYKTIRSVFDNVFVIKTGDEASSSVIFFASDTNFDKGILSESIKKYVSSRGQRETFFYIIDNDWIDSLKGGIVITDDYNPLDLWNIDTMEAWREYGLGYFSDILAR